MTEKISLPVQGMMCAACVSHVQHALEGVDGVNEAVVNLATEKATVQYNPQLVSPEKLIAAVQEAGYEVEVKKQTLLVGGMTCASCVAYVEHALAGLPGVVEVTVNLATEKAAVTYIPALSGVADFKRAITESGYEVLPTAEEQAEADLDREVRKMQAGRQEMFLS